MKIQRMQNANRQTRSNRRGISLFEVLISILVAAIGVFGVLVLIPFAVKSAEQGIDKENGINAAKNFTADFKTFGFDSPANWFDDDMPVAVSTPYLLDPIGAAVLGIGNYGQFPDTSSWDDAVPIDLPLLDRITVQEQDATVATPLSLELANRLCFQADGLKFRKPAEELEPPQQSYFSVDGIPTVKRQFDGRYKTVSIMIPEDDEGLKYKMLVLVVKVGDRPTNQGRVFRVDPNAKLDTGDPGRQYEQIGLGGGDLTLLEYDTGKPGIPHDGEDEIRTGDWFLLINTYRELADVTPFDDVKIGMYRVIHSDKTGGTYSMMPRVYDVTLQGADFDLFRDWDVRDDGVTVTADMEMPGHETYAIHIPNVLVVYERTIQVESDSIWN